MASLNKVLLIGNLTKDPELRYTPSGVAVANLWLAVNRKYKDKSGEWKEDTCFITVSAWDKQAEVCNQYLQKGRPVFVEGRLQSRNWETTNGEKRTTIDVRAERIQFLGSGQGPGRSGDAASPGAEDSGAVESGSTPSASPAQSGDFKPEDMAWEE